MISCGAWVALFLFPTFSYGIECMATGTISRVLIYVLIVLNLLCLFIYPVYLSFYAQTDPLIAAGLMFHSVTVWLKLLSFHHVMHDVRGLVRRVKSSKSPVPLNKFENTTLGVNQKVYEYAMTYPDSLSRPNFIRFMFAPTCCYQLVFPLEQVRSYSQIVKRAIESLGAMVVLVYLFYQHMIPVCKSSVVHF